MFSLPVYMLVCVTAYAPTVECCGKTDAITASGVKAQAGITVAADHLPFGTRIRFLDGSEYIVQDRFGAGHTDRIDIFMETEDECWEYGRQWRFAEVIKDERN